MASLFVLAICSSHAFFAWGVTLPDPPWYAKEVLSDTFDHNGPRYYYVIVPEEYPRRSLSPAIVYFHGNGEDAADAYYDSNITQKALRAGYVVVFAQGVPTLNSTLRNKERSWNAGSCCDYAFENDVDDVGYGTALLSSLPKKFSIDEKHIFLVGISNGASMVNRLTCEVPEKVAGLASVVGSLEIRDGRSCGSDCVVTPDFDTYKTCAWNRTAPGCSSSSWESSLPSIYECSAITEAQVPVIMFNGRLDSFSNLSGQVFMPTTKEGYYETYSPIDFVYDHFRKAYNCNDDDSYMTFSNGTSGNRTQCYSWSGCTNVTYCLSDAGHGWYGDEVSDSVPQAQCWWDGWNASFCNQSFANATAQTGPMTDSIHCTEQILEFFGRARSSIQHSSSIVV